MVDRVAGGSVESLARDATQVQTLRQLATLLRVLRRRYARSRRDGELTYRDLAARTGWSQTSIAEYFTAQTLPPTHRLDELVVLLGADPAEQRALATARDRIDEDRRGGRRAASPPGAAPSPAGPAPVPARPGGCAGNVGDASTGGGGVTPRQLPPAARHFRGRRRELAVLSALAGAGSTAGTVLITVIAGCAGIGKTALAVHWAHQVADRFVDGQLYVNLRGFDPCGPPTDPAEAIRRVLGALEVPPARIPADPEAQAALYRSLLAGKRILILLDNARDAAQVRPLLPAAAGCLVVITSRNRLSGLVAAEGAYPVALDLLSPGEAREVLASRLGAGRVAAEPAAVSRIVGHCARLPLALAVVAARAAAHPDLPLAAVARDLADVDERWEILADGDPHTDVQAAFSWSYRAVTPPAAHLFRLLSLHPGPDVSVAAAASLAAVAPPGARALLTELTRAGLAAEHRAGRYTCHDLLRAYASHLALRTDSEPDRRAATDRVIDHYLHTAHAASLVLDPVPAQTLPEPAAAGVTAERFTGYRRVLDWFTAEHAVLRCVLEHAAADGRHTVVGQLARAMAVFLDRQGHWHDGVAVWRTAIVSAARLGDHAAQARSYREFARAHTRLSRFDDAREHLDRALALATLAGDRLEQAHTHHMLAILCERRGELGQALRHSRQSLARYRAAGDRHGQAKATNAVGWHLGLLGDHEQALAHCAEALVLLRQLNDRAAESHTLDSLGHAHLHLGDHARAASCFRLALDLHRDLGDRHSEAEALDHLGDTQHAAGDLGAARRSWQQAIDVLTELAHPDAGRVRAKIA
jgi:tetratricopeptide (TPR) repeat protein